MAMGEPPDRSDPSKVPTFLSPYTFSFPFVHFSFVLIWFFLFFFFFFFCSSCWNVGLIILKVWSVERAILWCYYWWCCCCYCYYYFYRGDLGFWRIFLWGFHVLDAWVPVCWDEEISGWRKLAVLRVLSFIYLIEEIVIFFFWPSKGVDRVVPLKGFYISAPFFIFAFQLVRWFYFSYFCNKICCYRSEKSRYKKEKEKEKEILGFWGLIWSRLF